MLERLKKAMDEKLPIDIYFRISLEGGPKKCILFYSAFLVERINEENQTFEGYTIQDQIKPVDERIITTDSIRLICNIHSDYLNII